jgi:hypothetical protein
MKNASGTTASPGLAFVSLFSEALVIIVSPLRFRTLDRTSVHFLSLVLKMTGLKNRAFCAVRYRINRQGLYGISNRV